MQRKLVLYLKAEDNYYPIATYHEKSRIYNYFSHYVKMGKPLLVDEDMLNDIMSYIYCDIDEVNHDINKLKREIEIVQTLNNPVKDKIQMIYEIKSDLTRKEEAVIDYGYALNFLRFIQQMVNYNYSRNWLNTRLKIGEKPYVYADIIVRNEGYIPDAGYVLTDRIS